MTRVYGTSSVDISKDASARTLLTQIEQKYGEEIKLGQTIFNGFWKSPSGRRSADGQVVALAKAKGWIVVSNDQAVRQVCMLENVHCITWEEFARHLQFGAPPGQSVMPL